MASVILSYFFRMKGGIVMGRKVKITLPELKVNEVKINDKKIKINAHITLENYEEIISDIKSVILYNSEVEDKYCLLRARYIKDLLEICTNIDTSDFESEDYNSCFFRDLFFDNIDNFIQVEMCIEKEYDKWVMENCFGIIANKMPSSQDMEKSMKSLAETIENLPEDKLELISKSIVWNNMPALGQQIAPAQHIEA